MKDMRKPLFEPGTGEFAEMYALRDDEQELKVRNIQQYGYNMQKASVAAAAPIICFGIYKNNFKWFAPAGFLIVGAKYWIVNNFQRQMTETGLMSYWKKSKRFNGDLNRLEREFEKQKKEEKMMEGGSK